MSDGFSIRGVGGSNKRQGIVLSYMREDEDSARALFRNLKQNGLEVWMDKESTDGGAVWRQAFSERLSGSDYCICIFSKHYSPDPNRVFSQELDLALKELRRDKAFRLVPLRLEPCEVPNLSTAEGVRMADLHWVDVFGPHAEDALVALLKTLNARQPMVHFGATPQIQVRRLDNGEYPAALMANDRALCHIKADEEVSVSLPAGTVKMYARVYHAHSVGGQYAYDAYSFGRSEKTTVDLRPFGKYIAFIDASKIHQYNENVLSPLVFVAKKLLGMRTDIKEYNEDSWPPTLKMKVDRVYPY